jgi:hypothetical protein
MVRSASSDDTPYRRENHEAALLLRDASLSAMLLRMRRSNVTPWRGFLTYFRMN